MRLNSTVQPGKAFPDVASRFAPEIAAAGSAFSLAANQHSKLSLRMFEAARIATAAINGCTVCRNWRSARDAQFLGLNSGVIDRGPVPDEAFYEAVLAGDLSHLSTSERIAAEYAQRMGTDPQGLAKDDQFWAEVKLHLTDQEIVDLTYCTAGWMGLGRAAHVLGTDAICAIPTHLAAQAA